MSEHLLATLVVWTAAATMAFGILVMGAWRIARLRAWRVGRISRFVSGPDAAPCRRCKTTDAVVPLHPTPYAVTERGGRLVVFAICERCFDELGTPEARYPYYADLLVQIRERLVADGDQAAVDRFDATVPRIVAAIRVGV